MAIIEVPATVRFTDFEIWNDAVAEVMKSPFSGKRQVNKLPFDPWYFEGNLVPRDPMDAGPIKSFLMKLAGVVNTFKLKIAGSKYPVSNYAGPNGNMFNVYSPMSVGVNGLTINVAVLKEGDYFNIGNELKVCTAYCASDATGATAISFMPPLRNLTLVQVVTINDPFLYLASQDSDVARWNVKPPIRHGFKLRCEEPI